MVLPGTLFAPGGGALNGGLARQVHSVRPNGRYRRILVVAARSGEGLLSEPTGGTQPCRRGPLFMPQSCPSRRPWRIAKVGSCLYDSLLRKLTWNDIEVRPGAGLKTPGRGKTGLRI
jgi:hypothetical protein